MLNTIRSVIPKIILLVIFLILLAACQEEKKAVELLRNAERLAENNPQQAIVVLDSVPNPENLDTEDYMYYILLRTQANLKLNKAESGDSLIFDVQKYYNNSSDLNKAAAANLFAGVVLYKKQKNDKAFVSFLEAENLAKLADNYLIAGKSQQNIGSLYFEQDLMDSAITHFQRAINYYNRVESTDKYKLDVLNSIGRSYDNLNNYDSAYYYFNRCLEGARKIVNKEYVAASKQNLGIVLRQMKEYDRAASYFNEALLETKNAEDSVKLYFSLAKLYIAKHQLDSAAYYTSLAKDNVSKIRSKDALETLYGAVSDFYEETDNYKDALHYKELEAKVNNQIEKENSAIQLVSAQKKFKLQLYKEQTRLEMRTYIYIAVSTLLFIIALLLIFFYFVNKNNKQKRKVIEHQNKLLDSEKKVLEIDKELLQERVDTYLFIQNIYEDVFNEWTKLEKEIRAATENMYDKDLMVFGKVRLWMNNLSSVANVRFIFAAKDFLRREHNGEKLLKVLSDEDLLLFMLLYNEYSDDEIEAIMGDFLKEKDLTSRKEELVAQLYKAQLDNKLIKKFDKQK